MGDQVTIEKITYAGWPNCYRLANDAVELVVTADIGPRIIRYAFLDGDNVLVEFNDHLGGTGESRWVARGGHRLWAAPETVPDTYALDNGPVAVTMHRNGITLQQSVEAETGLQKQINIELAKQGPKVKLTHKIENTRDASRRLAPWALSMMKPGGIAIVALPPRGSHEDNLLPTNPLTMWAYTDFSDPRWTFTTRHILLRSDPAAKKPQKTGLFNPVTIAAYLLGDTLFVKRANAEGRPENYPDFGCSFEMFTNNEFIELETLGPLVSLRQGESTVHTEYWTLQTDVHLSSVSDEELERLLDLLR